MERQQKKYALILTSRKLVRANFRSQQIFTEAETLFLSDGPFNKTLIGLLH